MIVRPQRRHLPGQSDFPNHLRPTWTINHKCRLGSDEDYIFGIFIHIYLSPTFAGLLACSTGYRCPAQCRDFTGVLDFPLGDHPIRGDVPYGDLVGGPEDWLSKGELGSREVEGGQGRRRGRSLRCDGLFGTRWSGSRLTVRHSTRQLESCYDYKRRGRRR